MNEAISLETKGYFSTALFGSFRESDYLCDVTIISKDGQRFPAHRIILASASPFFRVMFKGKFVESHEAVVTLSNVDGAVTKMLMEYAYTGKTECSSSSLLSLYEAGNYVQFDGLFQVCSDWLKRHVDESNCVSMGIIADRYGDLDLLRYADRAAAVIISVLAESEDFLFLSAEHLSRILSHDELGTKSEDEVLAIFQKWIKHDEESRRAQVKALSKFVRFPLLDFEKSSAVLSDLDLISHYHSSGESCQRRVGSNGVLLVAGGLQPTACRSTSRDYDVSSEARVYDPNSDEWTAFPSLALGTYDHKIATSNDVLYALGGRTEVCRWRVTRSSDIVQRYDAKQRQWVDDVQAMSCGRIGYQIVCCDDHIYGMSIKDEDGFKSICEMLDSEKKTWIPVSSPGTALLSYYILSSLADTIFAIGKNCDYQLGYDKYDPLENRWCNFKSCAPYQYHSPDRYHATMGDRMYILHDNGSATIFDSHDERFSHVEGFFPFSSCYGLASDLESKRMYAFTKDQIAVYDERANKWDFRDYDLKCYTFDCAVVERKLMLDFVL
ncbi:kelch-like protein 20 [Oscarella lobularis]|uniref:kelch-like protein 20 n=1 Tax=Oscarella lobularis TaxID=121494 RepID=UPI0033143560